MRSFGMPAGLVVALSIALLAGCRVAAATPAPTASQTVNLPLTTTISPPGTKAEYACPVTEAEWVRPPEDAAVLNEPEFGYYLVNADRSIWTSAGWSGRGQSPLRTGAEGNKVGWFRPEGVPLELTGRRLDGQGALPAEALQADIPCCYPTRFQASALFFPAAGCWQVNARAAEQVLSFVVWVEP